MKFPLTQYPNGYIVPSGLRDTHMGYKKVEGTEDERVPFGDKNLKGVSKETG